MTDEKTCYNCGNKNCNVYYSIVKKDYKRHFETYEYKDFDCVNHDKWEELKIEEIHTDNTKTLQNALDRIEELEKENANAKMALSEAKELIKNIIRVTWGEGWNYSLDWKVKAEQFLLGSN